MRAGQLDRLFERFRRRGDVHALGEVFDATAPELYRVAVHLTRDLHEAEDLVQSTFLAAIEARDSYDAKRDLLPWLLGILTRKAAWERRKGSRVIEPDRLTARESTAPSGEAETSELSQSVTDAVERLPSPYREVLVAHLRVGKSPNEIALELGRAPGTVRVQLHRGLEMLRKALPAGFAVGALAGIAPRGFAALRAAILSSAETARASIVVGSIAAPVLGMAGGIAMSAKGLVAAAAALVAVVWIGLRVPEWTAPKAPLATQGSRAPIQAAAPEPTMQTAVVESPSERVDVREEEVQAQAEPTHAVVESSVSGVLLRPDGTGASGAIAALFLAIDGRPRESVAQVSTGSDGSFHMQCDPGSYFVVGLAEGYLPIALESAVLPNAELRLDPAMFAAGVRIRGQVRIAGLPAPAGCEINALVLAKGSMLGLGGQSLVWSEGRMLVRTRKVQTDVDGRFTFDGLEARLHLVSVDSTPNARILKAEREVQAPCDGLDLDIDYPHVIVRVQCDAGPTEAQVWMTPVGRGDVWGMNARPVAEAFVPPGVAYDVRVEKEGFSPAKLDVPAMKPGETFEKIVELTKQDDRGVLVIDVVAPQGETIHDAGFAFSGGELTPSQRLKSWRRTPSGKTPNFARDLHSDNGTFTLEELAPGRYDVSIRAGGTWNRAPTYWYHEPFEVELPANGMERRRVDLSLGGRLRIQCANRAGVWLPAHCQLLNSWGTEIPVGFCTYSGSSSWGGGSDLNASAPRGTNELAFNLAPGKYELRLSYKGYLDASRVIMVEPGKTSELSVVLEKG